MKKIYNIETTEKADNINEKGRWY